MSGRGKMTLIRDLTYQNKYFMALFYVGHIYLTRLEAQSGRKYHTLKRLVLIVANWNTYLENRDPFPLHKVNLQQIIIGRVHLVISVHSSMSSKKG